MLPLVLVIVATIAAAVVAKVAEPIVGFRRTLIGRRVLVNTKTEKAFDGFLYARRGDLLVLKEVRLLEPRAEPVSIDGDVVLERSVVDFVQIFNSSEG